MEKIKQDQDVQKLTEIPVRLLYDDIDLNFPTRYSCYKGNQCWCTGDGERAQRLGEGEISDTSPGHSSAGKAQRIWDGSLSLRTGRVHLCPKG